MSAIKLHLEINRIDLFQNIISLLEATCRDVINLQCMEDRIEIQSMNSSHTGMTHLVLHRNFFRKFMIVDGFKIGIHLPTFKKIILTADKYSIISLIIRSDTPDKYTVIIDKYGNMLSTAEGSRESKKSKGNASAGAGAGTATGRVTGAGVDVDNDARKIKKSQLISELFTFDCNEEMYGIPDIMFDSTTTMVTDEFVDTCTNLSKFGGEDICFQINPDEFIFNMKADTGDYKLTMLNSPDNTDLDISIYTAEDDSVHPVHPVHPVQVNGVLSYKILSTGFQIKKIADIIKLYISNQPSIPVKITADDAGEDDICSFAIALYFSQKNFEDDDAGVEA